MRDSRNTGYESDASKPFSTSAAKGVLVAVLVVIYLAMKLSCHHSGFTSTNVTPGSGTNQAGGTSHIDLPQTEQRLCTGVVILLDTSGSMSESVRDQGGRQRAKSDIARDALQRIIRYTGEWKKSHPDRILQMAIYNFSSSASQVLPMTEFDQSKAQAAAARVPSPGGGTAIGDAIEQGFRELYQSGCVRKHLVCITDGENTAGPQPERVAEALYHQTKGEVEMHFVAFDTSASHFGFLAGVNGHVVEAADGEQLQTKLAEIYEKRILAEAMPAEKP